MVTIGTFNSFLWNSKSVIIHRWIFNVCQLWMFAHRIFRWTLNCHWIHFGFGSHFQSLGVSSLIFTLSLHWTKLYDPSRIIHKCTYSECHLAIRQKRLLTTSHFKHCYMCRNSKVTGDEPTITICRVWYLLTEKHWSEMKLCCIIRKGQLGWTIQSYTIRSNDIKI